MLGKGEFKCIQCKHLFKTYYRFEHGKRFTRKFCSPRCRFISNRGSSAWAWKGGKFLNKATGYVMISTPHRHRRYTPEHRLVMEQKLGRLLKKHEIVHHINRKKNDNRISNLLLLSPSVHMAHHHKERRMLYPNRPFILKQIICHTCQKRFISEASHQYCSRKCYYKSQSKTWKNVWSLNYKSCLLCNTISIPHKGNGLCKKCYKKHWAILHQNSFCNLS